MESIELLRRDAEMSRQSRPLAAIDVDIADVTTRMAAFAALRAREGQAVLSPGLHARRVSWGR
jgi:hypothetical protein